MLGSSPETGWGAGSYPPFWGEVAWDLLGCRWAPAVQPTPYPPPPPQFQPFSGKKGETGNLASIPALLARVRV